MPNYNEVIADFQRELASLLAQRGQLDKRIASIMKAIDAIEVLAEESNEPIIEPPPLRPDEEVGFTNRVRAILKANPAKALTAVEIRDVLLQADPKEDAKVLLIHTHNTLKRLSQQDEVDEVPTPDGGRKGYRWQFPYGNLSKLGMLEDLTTRPLGRHLAAERERQSNRRMSPIPPPPSGKTPDEK